MNDVAPGWRAQPIRRGEEVAEMRRIESWGRKRQRAAKRTGWALGVVAAAELGAIVMLSGALLSSVPNIRLEPVYYERQSDGSIDPPRSRSHLPASKSEQDMRGAALQLVENCEGYNYADAKRRYDTCSLMLGEYPKKVYQARWFGSDKKPNPDSNPQALYPHGQIEIDRLGDIDVVRGHVVEIHFRRVVNVESDDPVNRKTCKAPECTTWTATIDFQPNEKMSQEEHDRVTSGLVAVRYQLSEGRL